MFVDTSAIVAILIDEPDAADYAGAIDAAPEPWIAPHVRLECCMVLTTRLDRPAEAVERDLDALLQAGSIRTMPLTDRHARDAFGAFRRFGKGRGHPAKLNFGDCLSYACAKGAGHALLFKGDDFNHTDLPSALTPGR